ncbi:MAG: protein-disulfide reductase DsbD domain-containing protein [Verrucomicrobiota bacterium]
MLGVLLLGGLGGIEAADEEGAPVSFELVSEDLAVRPGEVFTVGVRLGHDPGWHTYWKNPGIVGVATSIEWDLPEGFEAGEIQWPQPEVVKMAQMDAYGYEGDTVLLVDVKAPADLGGRASVDLKAKVIYMACASSCHPGFTDLELSLPVGSGGERRFDESVHRIFEEARASYAEDAGDEWSLGTRKADGVIRLDVELGAGDVPVEWDGVYFFDESGWVDSSQKQVLERGEGDGFVMELSEAEWGDRDEEVLEGILFAPGGWGEADRQAVRIRVPFKGEK